MVFKAFLIKYAEIGVKGKNRGIFEDALVRQIRYALKRCEGQFAVHRTRSGSMWTCCLKSMIMMRQWSI